MCGNGKAVPIHPVVQRWIHGKDFTEFKPRFLQKFEFTLAVCVSQNGKGELQFSSLTFADSGMYQCVAENYWGIKYANAELRVIGKNTELRRNPGFVFFVNCWQRLFFFSAFAPTFEFNPVKKHLLGARDRRVVIECKPRAAPRPQFTWMKGKELLFNNSRSVHQSLPYTAATVRLARPMLLSFSISILFDGSLEILNATKNDEGVYTCFAENGRGKANSSGYLTIAGQRAHEPPEMLIFHA